MKKSMPKAYSEKNSRMVWELQYFYAVLIYSIEYPYYNLSWRTWKNDRFYKQISHILISLMLPNCCKNHKQCKSKDQNLKNKYFKGQNPIDLLEISESQLRKDVLRLVRLE